MSVTKENLVNRVCNFSCDRISLFDKVFSVEKLTDLTLADEKFVDLQSTGNVDATYSKSPDALSCSHCQQEFQDIEAMKIHFKSDIHKRKLQLLFSMKIFNTLSSCEESSSGEQSSSEHESDDNSTSSCCSSEEDLDIQSITLSPDVTGDSDIRNDIRQNSHLEKVYFRNRQKEIVAIYRCLLFNKNNFPQDVDDLMQRVENLRQSRKWTLILWSGGKFCVGIFEGHKIVMHKTKQRYTSRKKQGGSQLVRDGKSNSKAKSAGSQLRRQLEIQFHNEFHDLLHVQWAEEIRSCNLVLLWVPRRHYSFIYPTQNESAGGFDRLDPRLRKIGINVGKVTHQRMLEIHSILSHYDVYDAHADISFLKLPMREQAHRLSIHETPELLHETESGRLVYTRVPDCDTSNAEESSNVPDKKMSQKKLKSPKPVEVKSTIQEDDPEQMKYDNTWFTAVFTHVINLQTEKFIPLLESSIDLNLLNCNNFRPLTISNVFSQLQHPLLFAYNTTVQASSNGLRDLSRLVGKPGEKESLLHFVIRRCEPSKQSDCESSQEILWYLLLFGCDPGIKNVFNQTAYEYASHLKKRSLQLCFRRFRYFFPTLYDYAGAKIPDALDPATEQEKKLKEKSRRKQTEKKRREQMQEKKTKEALLRQEEEEKRRFLLLSDREKRALAAERRQAAQCLSSGQPTPVTSRCFQCAADMTGKIPFQYLQYNFCSTKCLRLHRTAQTHTAQ